MFFFFAAATVSLPPLEETPPVPPGFRFDTLRFGTGLFLAGPFAARGGVQVVVTEELVAILLGATTAAEAPPRAILLDPEDLFAATEVIVLAPTTPYTTRSTLTHRI